MEPVPGIGPESLSYQDSALPLSYTDMFGTLDRSRTCTHEELRSKRSVSAIPPQGHDVVIACV